MAIAEPINLNLITYVFPKELCSDGSNAVTNNLMNNDK